MHRSHRATSATMLSVTELATPASPRATVLALHGIGLGAWLWERWAQGFAAAGLRLVAATLPGHGDGRADVGVEDLVRPVVDWIDGHTGGPLVLLGHSMGGLIAQVAAERRASGLAGLVLIGPHPTGNLGFVPDPRTVALAARHGLPVLASLGGAAPIRIPWALSRAVGLDTLDESTAREVHARGLGWPARLVRELARPPTVDPTAIDCPVLILLGRRDRLVPWYRARILGDLYDGIVWRYDDLGHFPMFQDGGARMLRDIVAWSASPTRPMVLESEGFGPAEGVGHLLRRRRRGEAMKRRSAYGQKPSARDPG